MDTGVIERYNILLESKSYDDEKLGHWLREKGIHSEQLAIWEQEIKDTLNNKDNDLKRGNQKLKKEKKELEKKLRRKEKALAEMAALVTLKKK